MADVAFAELFFTTNSKNFPWGCRFFSSFLEKGSMWISGSVSIGQQVLWQVNVPSSKVLLKRPIEDSIANSRTITVSFGKQFLFAEEGGREIYGISTETQLIEKVFEDENFQIDAMCCSDDHIYIFQRKRPDVIQILDSQVPISWWYTNWIQEEHFKMWSGFVYSHHDNERFNRGPFFIRI